MTHVPTLLNAAIDFNDRTIVQTLKSTVAQNLTDSEFLLFAEHCKATRLNPFKKEVWAIKAGGRLQIMTGINGFLAIANNHPEFDGMEVEVDDDTKPTKATCKVYRKDRKFPAVGVALMREYGKDSPVWKQMPRVMLTKVAKSIAIREAFPQELNGLYTVEEMPSGYNVPTAQPEVVEEGKQYLYDLTRIDEHKREAAKAVLLNANGSYVANDVYATTQPLPKLVRALLSEAEAVTFWEFVAAANEVVDGGDNELE
jgi:phage recombination protein Bet